MGGGGGGGPGATETLSGLRKRVTFSASKSTMLAAV